MGIELRDVLSFSFWPLWFSLWSERDVLSFSFLLSGSKGTKFSHGSARDVLSFSFWLSGSKGTRFSRFSMFSIN